MTTLYRPVLIESAEQANAMPKGTFIRLSIMSDSWTRLDSPEYRAPYETDEVPFTALVPIEAEEEYGGACMCGIEGCIAEGAPKEAATHRHYITPWEQA